MLSNHDIEILRELAWQYADIAALPVHAQKRKLWQDNNEFRPARPMVNIDQICWHEFAGDPFLMPQVSDDYWRRFEIGLRRKLYCWRHLRTDEVFHPYISVPKPIHNSGWGIQDVKDVIVLENGETATSQFYHNVQKIKMPELISVP